VLLIIVGLGCRVRLAGRVYIRDALSELRFEKRETKRGLEGVACTLGDKFCVRLCIYL
jgi:hypothetical protein